FAGHFRPGEKGRLRLRVVDPQSGAGVPAAVGLVMVDDALLALRPMQAGRSQLYFYLAEAASRRAQKLKATPAGLTLDSVISQKGDRGIGESLRQRAARILLAGAVSPDWARGQSWQTDPWGARAQAQNAFEERLSRVTARYARDHFIGRRSRGADGA